MLIVNRKIIVDKTLHCYHDKDFCRFNCGKIGWVWFVLDVTDQRNRWPYVLPGSNNNVCKSFVSAILFVYKNNKLIKVFLGNSIIIQLKPEKKDHIPAILPGAMASFLVTEAL